MDLYHLFTGSYTNTSLSILTFDTVAKTLTLNATPNQQHYRISTNTEMQPASQMNHSLAREKCNPSDGLCGSYMSLIFGGMV
jgi:hypothetical protein